MRGLTTLNIGDGKTDMPANGSAGVNREMESYHHVLRYFFDHLLGQIAYSFQTIAKRDLGQQHRELSNDEQHFVFLLMFYLNRVFHLQEDIFFRGY